MSSSGRMAADHREGSRSDSRGMSADRRSKRLSASSSEHDDDARGPSNYADWICTDSDCANVNFAKRTCCNRCGKDRGECPKKKKLGTEIGKAAAEKSKGLFSADDWQCNKCGNVNWARRQQCNMCNAPKFGDVEERTGYGGGYNDRGVVEYRERRNDDDDEYDEFGRRRKKRKTDHRSDEESKDSSRHSSSPRSRSKSSYSRKSYRDKDDEKDDDSSEEEQRKKRRDDKESENENDDEVDEDDDEEDEEDEDDDDDDDGDLSKYDLSEWDNLAAAKNSTNGNASSSQENQSR